MLVDELLIKVGVDIDASTVQRFEQFVQALGESAVNGAEELQGLAESLKNIADETTEQVKKMPEFDTLFNSIEELNQAQQNLSQDEAIALWMEKIQQSEALLAELGQNFFEDTELLRSQLLEAGASAEQVEQIFSLLNAQQEKLKKATEDHTDTVDNNTDALGKNGNEVDGLNGKLKKNEDALKNNAEQAEDLGEKLLLALGSHYGVEQLTSKFEFLGIAISQTALKIAGIGAALLGATAGVTAFVDSQFDTLDEIHQLANVTGEASDQIYNLGKVAEVNGSSMQAAQSSIEGLSRTIGEAATGVGRGAKAFEQYGLSAKKANGEIKSAGEMMGEISDKMQALSKQEQIAMLSKLGIDGSMIQVLRLGNSELAKSIENAKKLTLGVGTAENAEEAAAFKDAMTELAQIFKAIGEYLALRISPAIRRLIDQFKEWFLANNEMVKAVLNGFGKIFSFIFDLIGAVSNVIDNTLGWRNAIFLVGAAVVWLSRKMLMAFATNPLAWIIAAIVGFILLIDDFITYLKGGETALGDFWEPFAQGLDWVMEKFHWLKTVLSDFWGLLTSAFDWVMAKFQWLKNSLKNDLPEWLAAGGIGLALFWRQFMQLGSGTVSLVKRFSSVGKAVISLINRFSDIRKVFSIFNRLFGFIKKLYGISKIFGIFSRLISIIRAVGMAIRLAFMANPLGVFIAAVIAIGYAIYKNWDLIKKVSKEFLDELARRWDEFWDTLGAMSSKVFDFITSPFKKAWEWVTEQWNAFTDNFSVDPIGTIFGLVIDLITAPFRLAFELILGLWQLFTGQQIKLDGLTAIFENAKKVIIDKFKAAFDFIGKMWNKITGWFNSFFDDEKEMNIKANISTAANVASQGAMVADSAMKLSSQVSAGAVSNRHNDNSVKNSNNKTIVNVALNGSGHSVQDAQMIGNVAARHTANQGSMIAG